MLNRLKLVDAPQQCAFPRAARPADHDHLARTNLQVHIPQDVQRSEPFVDAFEGDHEPILIALFGQAVNNEVGEIDSRDPFG